MIFVLKNRRPLVSYSVSHERIGVTAEDDTHGRVEVTYRGSVVTNLYLSVMEIKNHSMKDIENLYIKTYRGSDKISMLSEEAHIEGTLESVNLTQEYQDRQTLDQKWEEEIHKSGKAEEPENVKRQERVRTFHFGQRHYLIPLLNRGQIAKITYLIAAEPDTMPVIYMTCQTKGVRVKQKPHPQALSHILGVPITEAALVGTCLGAIAVGVIIWQISTYWIGAGLCFILGSLASVPGALSIKAYDWLRGKMTG